jgi:hypothetical protein
MNLLSEDIKIYNFKLSFAALLWFLLAAIGVLLKINLGYDKIGNFLIFRNAFWHTLHQVNLYNYYPSENLGSFLYGPLFSFVIAPFSFLSINAGAFLWGLSNALVLFLAIRNLPVSYKNQNIILVVCAIEMMTSVQNMQINCLVAALIIFAFTFVKKEQDFWAAMFIAIGFLVKLYGIVGIAFLLFSNHKSKFIFSFLFWSIVLFCLPMVLSSPSFIVQSYVDWYHTLLKKDNANTTSFMQNISVMGMLRHFIKTQYLDLVVIFVAAWFYLLPLFRFDQFKNKNFQLSYLSFLLIGVVIFSSSAESPTYIIAMTGVALWFVIQDPKNGFVIGLLWFAIIITSVSATDLFPRYIKTNLIQPYALKGLPPFVVWMVIAGQLLSRKVFDSTKIGHASQANSPG